MIYTGIGSRSTPLNVQGVMTGIAQHMAKKGWTLRSGHAHGADSAFELGASSVKGSMEIYIPWNGFNGGYTHHDYIVPHFEGEILEIAAKHHPAWERLTQGAKKLHARNVCQILGIDLNKPADMLVCWTPGGNGQGGTGQAIRIANAYDIPVFDLAKQSDCTELMRFVNGT